MTPTTPNKKANEAASSPKPDGVPSNAMTNYKVESNSSIIDSSPTPSKRSYKKSPFCGNIRSPAPKVDSILIKNLTSPEKQSIKELEGELKFRSPQEKKKFENRSHYLQKIQKNDPERFTSLCNLHGNQVNDNDTKKSAMTGIAPEKVISFFLAATPFGDAEEDRENVVPSKTSKALFHKKEDKNIQSGKSVLDDGKNKVTKEDDAVLALASMFDKVNIIGENQDNIDEALQNENGWEAHVKIGKASSKIKECTEDLYLHAIEMEMEKKDGKQI